jgi:hypothetical protein
LGKIVQVFARDRRDGCSAAGAITITEREIIRDLRGYVIISYWEIIIKIL